MIDIIVRPRLSKIAKSSLGIALQHIEGARIIEAKDFAEGLQKGKGEFICYIGNGLVSNNFFVENLSLFSGQEAFKKLAMVSSAVADPSLSYRMFGYALTTRGLEPVEKRASSMPYCVQVGYMPGAIIRRSSIEHIKDYLNNDPVHDSYQASIDFWLTGKRCYVNPTSLYVDFNYDRDNKIQFREDPWSHHEQMQNIKDMWKREVI